MPVASPVLPIRIVALYRFAPIADPAALRDEVERRCRAAGVLGTLLVADEGINGTIAGADDGVGQVLAYLQSQPGCDTLGLHESRAAAPPFGALKVKVKREIVTMGVAGIDPRAQAGRHVDPREWNALLAQPGTLLIDTRNGFEVAMGSFAGAIDPGTHRFGEFPAWFRAHRDAMMAPDVKRVAMFCTGGIRCEKATAFLRREGVEDVYHLRGGILAYLDQVPAEESLWQGECFVFDDRVTAGAGTEP